MYLVESITQSFLNQAAFPVVLDYVAKSGSISSETFDPRYTYRINGNLNVSGTLTVLPGTTVKVDYQKSINISSGAKILAEGEPYNYITFTKASDNSCGEQIPGAPVGSANYLIRLNSGSALSIIQYCKMAWAVAGVYASSNVTLQNPIANSVMMHVGYGVLMYSPIVCQNNLFYDCSYGIYSYGSFAPTLANNTADDCWRGIFAYTGYAHGGDISYNLLSHCTCGIFCGFYSYPTLHTNGYYNNDHDFHSIEGIDPGPYNQYLETDPYADSAMGDWFLKDVDNDEVIQKLINQPPDTAQGSGLGNDVFSVFPPKAVATGGHYQDESWSKIAIDEPGSLLDIGYHHCRVDKYVPSNTGFAGAGVSLTIEPGVVVALARDSESFWVYNGAELACVGDPTTEGHNAFVNSESSSMWIESRQFGLWEGPALTIYPSASDLTRIRFTKFIWLKYGIDAQRNIPTYIRDNVFALNTVGVWSPGYSNTLRNNLFHRNSMGVLAAGSDFECYSNTFDTNDTGLYFVRSTSHDLVAKDNLFTDSTPASVNPQPAKEAIALYGSGGGLMENHNAFYGNTHNIYDHYAGKELGIGSGSIQLEQSPYEGKKTGCGASWFLRQTPDGPGDLIAVDAGSQSSCDAGLRIYTTDSGGDMDEGQVDIGYHHPFDDSVIFVDGVNGNDQTGDGSYANPYATIGKGVLQAGAERPTVYVLPAVYTYDPTSQGNETLDLNKSNINLYGSGARLSIIASAQLSNEYESFPLIKIAGQSDIELEGFTIRGRDNEMKDDYQGYGGAFYCYNADAVRIRYCTISENRADYGAGIYIKDSDVLVEGCLIYGNRAESGVRGGGIYVTGPYGTRPWPTIANSIIAANGGGDSANPPAQGGGGIACEGASAAIEGCIIANNAASLLGLSYVAGGVYIDSAPEEVTIANCAVVNNQASKAGGIYTVNSDVRVEDCLFAANVSQDESGGGLRSENSQMSQITVERSAISRNICLSDSWPHGAGGMYWSGNATARLVSCTFSDNTAYDGAAVLIDVNKDLYPDARSTILNCTMADNVMTRGIGSTIYNTYSSHRPDLAISNCILWGNVQQQDQTDLWQCEANYSDVQVIDDRYPGSNNIQADPEFFSTAYGYYHLPHYEAGTPPLNRSQCVDHGNELSVPQGTTDIDGEDRIIDAPPPPGQQDDSDVDMGCDEAHPFKASLRISKNAQGGSSNITLTWNYEEGETYEVYRSVADRTYSDRMGWENPITWPEEPGQTSWTDSVSYDDADRQRYYRVKDVNGTYAGTFTYAVGFINVPVKSSGTDDQYTLISVPLQARSEKVNEGLGAMIAERLTGSSGSGTAHQLLLGHWDWDLVLEEWRLYEKVLWLDTNKIWRDEEGNLSEERIKRGDGPTLVIRSSQQNPPPVITFLGYVPMDLALFGRIREDAMGELQTPWGISYPVETTLNDIPFLAFGAVGMPLAEKASADRMLVDRAGESSWKTLWLRDDGVWMDWDTDIPASIPLVRLVAGKGFHYKMGPAIPTGHVETRYIVLRRPYEVE